MGIGVDLGFPEERFKFEPDNRWVLPYCRIGVEFEFEKVRQAVNLTEPWVGFWEMKRDGSLHDAGQEFAFRQPLFGADAYKAIKGLCEWAIKAKYASSIRTGIHVHVDARDLELVELQRLCVLYALYERAIYNFVGDNREENVFCLPWHMANGATKAVKGIINSTGVGIKAAAARIADEKYAGLNLDPLARFGSIEFRHLLTTSDLNRVISWINIAMRFKEAAIRMKVAPLDLIKTAQEIGAIALGEEVFQKEYGLLHYQSVDVHMNETGIATALDVVLLRNRSWKLPATSAIPSDKWKTAVNKFKQAKPKAPKTPKKKKSAPQLGDRPITLDVLRRANEQLRGDDPRVRVVQTPAHERAEANERIERLFRTLPSVTADPGATILWDEVTTDPNVR